MAGDKGSDGNLGGTPSKGAGGQGNSDLFADLFSNSQFDNSRLTGEAAEDINTSISSIDTLSAYRTETGPVENASFNTARTSDEVANGTLPELSFFHEEPQPEAVGETSTDVASAHNDNNTESVAEQTALAANDKAEADFKPREYASSTRRDMIGSIEKVGAVSEPARDHLASLSQRFSSVG